MQRHYDNFSLTSAVPGLFLVLNFSFLPLIKAAIFRRPAGRF